MKPSKRRLAQQPIQLTTSKTPTQIKIFDLKGSFVREVFTGIGSAGGGKREDTETFTASPVLRYQQLSIATTW